MNDNYVGHVLETHIIMHASSTKGMDTQQSGLSVLCLMCSHNSIKALSHVDYFNAERTPTAAIEKVVVLDMPCGSVPAPNVHGLDDDDHDDTMRARQSVRECG